MKKNEQLWSKDKYWSIWEIKNEDGKWKIKIIKVVYIRQFKKIRTMKERSKILK